MTSVDEKAPPPLAEEEDAELEEDAAIEDRLLDHTLQDHAARLTRIETKQDVIIDLLRRLLRRRTRRPKTEGT